MSVLIPKLTKIKSNFVFYNNSRKINLRYFKNKLNESKNKINNSQKINHYSSFLLNVSKNIFDKTATNFGIEKSDKLEEIKLKQKKLLSNQKLFNSVFNQENIKNEILNLSSIKKSLKRNNSDFQIKYNSFIKYKQENFGETKYSNENSFSNFYSKLHKILEYKRKDCSNINTPSFNFIDATKKFKIIPNPIGIIKRKGKENVINLNHKRMGDSYLMSISNALSVSNHITSINLSENRINDYSLVFLCKTIENNYDLINKINSLDLSYNNKIYENGINSLCEYFSNSKCVLEKINLEGNYFGNRLLKKLIENLYKNLNNNLLYANFGLNDLDDEICECLAKFIDECKFLKVLILFQNKIKNHGMSLIMNKIKSHNFIKFLDISWNLIGYNLNDNIPKRKELKNKILNNLELEEIKLTMKFKKKEIVSSLKKIPEKNINEININKNSILSEFTKELCDLFKNKNSKLLHLDISHNNIGYIDCVQIEKDIKHNHSILGIHVDGNEMFADELGFIHAIDKNNYQKNHFANSQIFYKIDHQHPLIKSKILNIKKIRAKNNCWICEGWNETLFKYKLNSNEKTFLCENKNICNIHFNFEDFKQYEMIYKDEEDEFICYRMCPPGEIFYFVTFNGTPCSNYDKSKIKMLKNPIVHTDNLNLYSENSTENQNDMFYETDSIKNNINNNNFSKEFVINTVQKENVIINPDVIDSNVYVKQIKYCVPRPEKKHLKKKRTRISWEFSMSIWAFYGYLYEGESAQKINNSFEFDFKRGQYSIDKDLRETKNLLELKKLLRNYYPFILDSYKYLSSLLGWKIPQIGQNQITEFANICPNLLDNKYLINDVLVKLTETKNNSIDKKEKKNNPNIPDNIIRHQWMQLLVKISKDKYYRTKVFSNLPDAVKYAFENHFNFYLKNFNNYKWRIERYYNEFTDNVIKAYLPLFNAVYKSVANEKIVGRKDSICLWLEDFTYIITNLMDNEFPVKEIPTIFILSIKLQVNEINSDRFYSMTFPEFLEAFARFADKMSPIPPGQNKSDWNLEKRVQQDLYVKIETLIPSMMKLIGKEFKLVKEKFVMPVRDEETGLLMYDINNEFYVNIHPPKGFGRKKVKNN